MIGKTQVETIASELVGLLGKDAERDPLTDDYPELDLPTGYRIGEAIRRRRELAGDRWIGRKIGFTNFRMWDIYAVKAPIWGPMYESTVLPAESGLSLSGFPNPKIEPEVVFALGVAPQQGMGEDDLLRCIDWIALGFEVVSSIYPGWRFNAADAVAGFGVHALLATGARLPAFGTRGWVEALASFKLDLFCDNKKVAEGKGSDVLGSPLSALRHLNDLVSVAAFGPPLMAGEVITTGTITLAMPVRADEAWRAVPSGIALPPLETVIRE